MGAQYEFYVVMRWAVTAMAIWMSVVAGSLKRAAWVVVFIPMALLFNPLIPVYATRQFWLPFDFAGFVLFWVAGVKIRASKPAPAEPLTVSVAGSVTVLSFLWVCLSFLRPIGCGLPWTSVAGWFRYEPHQLRDGAGTQN